MIFDGDHQHGREGGTEVAPHVPPAERGSDILPTHVLSERPDRRVVHVHEEGHDAEREDDGPGGRQRGDGEVRNRTADHGDSDGQGATVARAEFLPHEIGEESARNHAEEADGEHGGLHRADIV